MNGIQVVAIIESVSANVGDAVANRHGGQAAATPESIFADGGDAVGDGHGGQAAVTIESIVAYGGDAVGFAISNRCGDDDFSRITRTTISTACNRYRSPFTAIIVTVVDAINLEVIGIRICSSHTHEYGEQECDSKCFHFF